MKHAWDKCKIIFFFARELWDPAVEGGTVGGGDIKVICTEVSW